MHHGQLQHKLVACNLVDVKLEAAPECSKKWSLPSSRKGDNSAAHALIHEPNFLESSAWTPCTKPLDSVGHIRNQQTTARQKRSVLQCVRGQGQAASETARYSLDTLDTIESQNFGLYYRIKCIIVVEITLRELNTRYKTQ